MPVLLTTTLDPYAGDGLGRASRLGVGFVRQITVNLNAFATTATIVPSDIGAIKFFDVFSIVPKTAQTWFVSAFSETSITLTGSTNAAIADVMIICAGI